jgi:hypothetical protein
MWAGTGHSVHDCGDRACTGCIVDVDGHQWVGVGPYMAAIAAIGHTEGG